MKQYIFLLFGILALSGAFAQYPVQPSPSFKQDVIDYNLARVRTDFPMVSQTRAILESAVGWTLQNNGLWLAAQNQIPWKDPSLNRPTRLSHELSSQDRESVDEKTESPKQRSKTQSQDGKGWNDPVPDKGSKPSFKLGQENFINLEIRDVIIKNEIYVVFIIRFRTGWYEFPMLMQEWHKQTGITYYVCKLSRFRTIIPEKMEFNKVYVTNCDVLCDGTLFDFDETFLNSTIGYNIDHTLSSQSVTPRNLIFAFVGVQGGGKTTARFKYVQVMNKERFYLPYLDPKNRDKVTKSSYYECDFMTFKNFIHYNGGSYAQPFTGTPATAEEYYRRGLSDYSMGNYVQCISNLNEASKYTPYATFFMTYAYRANARMKLGDNSAAILDFDKAVSLKPAEQNYYTAWLTVIYNRGVAKFNNKDKDGACCDWNTALQFGLKDMSNDQAIKDNCRGYRFTGPCVGLTQSVSNNFNDAGGPETITDYFKVYWEGVWKYEHGNFEDALRYFNRAIELRSQDKAFMVYYYRGSCRLKLSDFAGALTDLDMSLAFNANSQGDASMLKSVYYNHGMANYMLGNYAMACSDFQKAKTAGMNTPESVDFMNQVCK